MVEGDNSSSNEHKGPDLVENYESSSNNKETDLIESKDSLNGIITNSSLIENIIIENENFTTCCILYNDINDGVFSPINISNFEFKKPIPKIKIPKNLFGNFINKVGKILK